MAPKKNPVQIDPARVRLGLHTARVSLRSAARQVGISHQLLLYHLRVGRVPLHVARVLNLIVGFVVADEVAHVD